jgi:hypothetical protein
MPPNGNIEVPSEKSVEEAKIRKEEASKNVQDEYLGVLRLSMAGTQYHDAVVTNSETVILEREPHNAYDANAIVVQNQAFEKVGYVPRRIAAWMANLVDCGKLQIVGYIPDAPPIAGKSIPLNVRLYLTTKGKDILHPQEPYQAANQILHSVMLAAYRQAQSCSSQQVLRGLVERLYRLLDRDTSPETHLLFSLLRAKSENEGIPVPPNPGEGEQVIMLKNLLKELEIGEPRHHHNLTLFPLRHPSLVGSQIITLAEAIQSKQASVSEVSAGGNVPTLKITNHSPHPLLVPEGEILTGGKQNRTINLTVVIGPKSDYIVPVSCVEQGRWRSVSSHFMASHYSPPNLRARKVFSAHENRARFGQPISDQAGVWADCRSYLDDFKVAAPTGSIAETYQACSTTLEDYRQNLSFPKGYQGFAMASQETILGVELFDSEHSLEVLWERLSRSYFLAAARDPKSAPMTEVNVLKQFLQTLAQSLLPTPRSQGSGQEYEIRGSGLVGSAVCYEDRLLHLVAFTHSGS